MDREAALHAARPGKQDLHRLLEPGTGAGWAEDGEVVGAAAELSVEHQERQAAEVVAVQVGDQHRLDLVGVDLLLAQRGQAGRSAVQQHAGRVRRVGGEGDAGLEPATGAERISTAHRRHAHDAIIPLPGGSWEGRITAGTGSLTGHRFTAAGRSDAGGGAGDHRLAQVSRWVARPAEMKVAYCWRFQPLRMTSRSYTSGEL